MTDLHTRLRTLDDLPAPDLWPEVEAKASATQRGGVRTLPWVLIAATLLLALAVGGAVLIGSGVVKMPVVDLPAPAETSAAPSSTPRQNSAPTWTSTGKMIEIHDYTATLLLDGKVLVAGEDNLGSPSAELYDPRSGTWSATRAMTVLRHAFTATLLLDGTVLVAGGNVDSSGTLAFVSSAELYDPRSGTWTAAGNMIDPYVAYGYTATLLLDGKVLVAGGENSDLPSAELYDPSSGTWAATGNMIEARLGHTATLLPDGKVLVAGGNSTEPDDHSVSSAELYDPSSGTWTATGNMVEARHSHTATLLLDGKVLVAGEDNRGSPSAELYDPRSGTWSATRAMTVLRHAFTATLLLDGKVLAAGGVNDSGPGLPVVPELYDPSSGTWTATAAMIVARDAPTATRLLDGRVLVVGGDNSGPPSAELYDPGDGS